MSQPETEHHCHRLSSGRFVRLAVEFVPGHIPSKDDPRRAKGNERMVALRR